MADDGPRDRFDDWFDEPGTPDDPDAWSSRVDRLVRERRQTLETDDWVAETAPRARVSSRRSPVSTRAAVGLAALAVCLLLGILAAAGVFSSGSQPRRLATTTVPTVKTTPATTTVTTAPAIQVPTTPLKPGASGADVKLLQRALARAGYSTGGVDGTYGPATSAAVSAFQRAQGLSADGVAGPKTLAALQAALQQGTG